MSPFATLRMTFSHLLQCFRRINRIPPSSIILQPLGEPSPNSVLPLDALAIIHDVMILTCHQYHGGFTTKEFQSSIHLDTFAHWHIHIGITMYKKQWSMNLVGIEERTSVYIQVLASPWIAVGHADFAIRITPIAFAPITVWSLIPA